MLASSTLRDTYSVGISEHGKPTIIIKRRLAEIPFRIDWDLLEICGSSCWDMGHNTYECLKPERFPRALKCLDDAQWTMEE